MDESEVIEPHNEVVVEVVDLMSVLLIGLGVIPSHWTRRGLRAPTAWGSWFY